MNEVELRTNAALNELQNHLTATLQRCIALAADNAVLQAKIKELSKPPEKPEP